MGTKIPNLRVREIIIHIRPSSGKSVFANGTTFKGKEWRMALTFFLDKMRSVKETPNTLKRGAQLSIRLDQYVLTLGANDLIMYYDLKHPDRAESHRPQNFLQKQICVCLGNCKSGVEGALKNLIDFDTVRIARFNDFDGVHLYLWKTDDDELCIDHWGQKR